MSPHVVDVAIMDIGKSNSAFAGLKAVDGPVVSLRIMARGVLSMGLISRLIPEMAVALYCAGKVPAKCAFSHVSFDFNPEVPAGMVRVVLLPAGAPDATQVSV